MDFSDLINDYLDDANRHLDSFDAALLSLERSGLDREIVENTLGSLHTLKGNSGMMGYESMKLYVHRVEELLKRIVDEERGIEPYIDVLFDSANVIRKTLREIEKNSASNPDLAEGIINLESFLAGTCRSHGSQTVDLSSYLGMKTDTIRVGFKRLDTLLDLVGELVIFKTRLNQIETQIRPAVSKNLAAELKNSLELMGKTVSSIQEGIMKARVLPVKNVFDKFPRMVRDLSKAQSKEIGLFFEGEDTEFDKTVIDELEEPLLHILRNAIDHGIEPPEERVRQGKPAAAKITLSAGQESNYVIITVRDDGRGIDLEKVREKGLEKGLISPEEAFDRETALSLIFSVGFSTKDEITDLSGRGVGLDVVSKNISKLSGSIIVDSVPGSGTSFTIKLPLSLAIIPALMAEAGGEVYAIPMGAVDESIKVKEEDIHIINNKEVVTFREKVLPVVRLDEFFGLERTERKKLYLVVLGKAERRLAVAVDRVRGQQEIVIKPLDDTFGKSYGIAGASILGDGRIVLIVDIMTLFEKKEQSANG